MGIGSGAGLPRARATMPRAGAAKARAEGAGRRTPGRGTGIRGTLRRRAGAVLASLTLAAVAACSSGGGSDNVQRAGDELGVVPAGPPGTSAAPLATSSPTTSARTTTPSTGPSAATSKAPARPSGPFPKPRSMAALGDSITRGYDACSVPLKDCPSKSWATGDDVDSHAKRLGVPRDAVHNDARTGARMNELDDQARVAVGQGVEYVTILLGANDACRDKESQMTSVSDFEQQLREGLTVLRQGLPGVRVLVVSVPDVARLWEVARGERLARAVWSTGICQTVLADPESTKPDDIERRQRVRDRVVAYNEVLRKTCNEWAEQCRYDGGAVNAHRFTKNDLSHWDWFHPSGQGQGVIAELTSRNGFRWQA
ncbi:SGNH/GDSL hydrolase family protein [Streptodolium elevatio]